MQTRRECSAGIAVIARAVEVALRAPTRDSVVARAVTQSCTFADWIEVSTSGRSAVSFSRKPAIA